MDYELAKELKDAGFQQNTENVWVGNGHEPTIMWERARWEDFGPHIKPGDEQVYAAPTRSELIEACGRMIEGLGRTVSGGWYAEGDDATTYGPTPEEAVARLWLALHTKR